MIFGKLYNARWSMERTLRDHKMRVDEQKIRASIDTIKTLMPQVMEETSLESLRGLEGVGATAYFNVFDDRILREKEAFFFHGRNRRPPLDNVNAMLSFAYSLLTSECASALERRWFGCLCGIPASGPAWQRIVGTGLMEELRACVQTGLC